MARPVRSGTTLSPRDIIGYSCAVVLPVIATWITLKSPALHGIPFALSFTIIAALGALSGPGPALISILVSIIAFNLLFSPWLTQFGAGFEQMERSLVLLAAAFFLTFLSWKQKSAENKFRSTLDSLRQRTSALSQAQQASELATWVFHVDTMQTYWDEGSTEIFGRPFTDLNGKALPLEFVVPEDRDHLVRSIERATRSDQPLHVEFRVQWPNGDIHWLEARGIRVSKSPHIWHGSTFDVTRRKAVEGALVRSEKLAAMGRLSSTVAHEVNNPLESVTNLLYLIRHDKDLSDTTRSYVTLAEEELARLANITRLTLSFARSGSLRSSVNVADIIDAVLSIYQRRCDSLQVVIERFYSPGLEIEILPHELRQILINLIANALDALTPNDARLRLHVLREDNSVVVLIEDNGIGIQVSDKSRVFDAFFTTKSDVGTGIGLWVTRELVAKNGGTISVESGDLAPNVHTRFRLEFPSPFLAGSVPSRS